MRYWFVALLLGFWLTGFVNTARINSGHNDATDGTSEQLVGYSARKFASEGFWKTYLLPRYPAFGEGLDGKPRSGEFIYNHYLAGADIVLATWIKLFGESSIPWARLMPHTLTVAATACLCFAAGTVFGGWLFSCLLMSALLCARALTTWSICLYSHSYATAVAFLFMGFNLYRLSLKQKATAPWKVLAPNIAFGFFVTWFSLDWVAGTLIAFLALLLALGRRWNHQTAIIALGYCSGVALALLYQLTLSALYFGGLMAVVEDITRWIGLRSGIDTLRADAIYPSVQISRSMNYLIREFNKQAYGATGFTAFNLLAMAGGFALLGWASRALKAAGARAAVGAALLSYVAASIWHTFMKHHSAGNMHFILRHYLLVYLVCTAVIFRISLLIVERGKKTS